MKWQVKSARVFECKYVLRFLTLHAWSVGCHKVVDTEKMCSNEEESKFSSFFWYVFKYQFKHFKHQHICQMQRTTRAFSRRRCDGGGTGKMRNFFQSIWCCQIDDQPQREFSCLKTTAFGSTFSVFVFECFYFPSFVASPNKRTAKDVLVHP